MAKAEYAGGRSVGV